mgnify:CR=1 FL=1
MQIFSYKSLKYIHKNTSLFNFIYILNALLSIGINFMLIFHPKNKAMLKSIQ